MPTCFILLLNYNNAPDTIACIRSVSGFPDTGMLIIDNDSKDDSLAQITAALIAQKITHRTVDAVEATTMAPATESVLIFKSPVNLGFAGGNNVLLRYALRSDAKYAWLLNNDAIAAPDALAAMITTMNIQPDVAFAGSVILDFEKRNKVQCCGVRYHKYFGVSKLQFKDRDWNTIDKKMLCTYPLDFQHGASLLVRLSAIKEGAGLMDERYFLYFEEHDWQWNAHANGWKNVLAPESIVWHKGSVSTNNKKHLFFYYYNKSSVLFSRKHNSVFEQLVSSVLLTGVTIVRTKLFPKSLLWGLKGIIDGWRYRNQ